MTGGERAMLDFASRSLDYPDAEFYASLPALGQEAEVALDDAAKPVFRAFLDALEKDGAIIAQQKYVAAFDHDPANSLYLAWHRYGNDRGQGKALAALNALYRAAGLEPVYGSMPDYLPRMLEFMAVSEDWAVEVMLDGFGPEMWKLAENLSASDPMRASILKLAFEPLKERWPQLFKPREGRDATLRPMARPEPESIPRPLDAIGRMPSGQEDNI